MKSSWEEGLGKAEEPGVGGRHLPQVTPASFMLSEAGSAKPRGRSPVFFCLRIPPFLPRTHGSEAPVSVLPPVRSLSMVQSGPFASLLRRSLLDSDLQAVCLFTCEVCQEPSHMGGHVDISYCQAGPWIFNAGTESLLTKELMSQGLGQPRGCWSKFFF